MMYEIMIKEYLKKLSINDINIFANKNNIYLKENEDKIIYEFIMNYWKDLYNGDYISAFNVLKNKISNDTYIKSYNLYIMYKNKYKNI